MSTTRIQLAPNVDDVTVATAFYEKMFGFLDADIKTTVAEKDVATGPALSP